MMLPRRGADQAQARRQVEHAAVPSETPAIPGPSFWRGDRTMGVIGISMWAGTLVKVWNLLPLTDNLQSLAAITAMFLIVVAWPTWARASYMRWRVPALAFLRVFLIALPFNFKVEVFDAIAPEVGTGRLAVVSNTFNLLMAIRIALLTFTSLGWRVPFRLHMVLQALNVMLFIRFGMQPYCRSKLLTSPELDASASAVHSAMSFLAMIFVPSTAVLVPAGREAQRVAFLLFCWSILGWLLPTLLLLPDAVGGASRLAGLPEAALRLLLPSKPQAMQPRAQQQGQLGGAASCALYWLAVLLVVWGTCCSVAPLFKAAHASAA